MEAEAVQYDSRPETWRHIHEVQKNLAVVIRQLMDRQLAHDQSKLDSPEREAFDAATPLLAGTTYGSEEYKRGTAMLGPALQHHYDKNRHHPEHHRSGVTASHDGISGMNLVDLIEMLCDWKAAVMRHDDGDIHRSIAVNVGRFGIEPQLVQILKNTVCAVLGA